MKHEIASRQDARRTLSIVVVLATLALLLPTALAARDFSCEEGNNQEGGCCCFLGAHTYVFNPTTVSQLGLTFDTGRGLNCQSQVAIQVLADGNWQTVHTVNAVSSSGNNEKHHIRGTLNIDRTISGVRINDGARCYIDYSQISFDAPDSSGDTGDPPQPVGDGKLRSGAYRMQAHSDRTYGSLWELEVVGDRITGSSQWDCCPGRRTDTLQGRLRGDQVTISRSCAGQGAAAPCKQVYEGKVAGDRVGGSFNQNGRFAGWWKLDLTDVGTGPEKPRVHARIVASPPPPYLETPLTIEFMQEPEPVPDAVWWMDGRRMTNAEIFFWTFGEKRAHTIELRTRNEVVARLNLGLASTHIVPDQKPPFTSSATITFHQEPAPVAGARWSLAGRPMSDAATFAWRFEDGVSHKVTLKSKAGKELDVFEGQVGGPETYQLWGKQTRDRKAAGGMRTETRQLELRRTSVVTKVEGNAAGFCVWTASAATGFDRKVLCGGKEQSVAGAFLPAGNYVVLPNLEADQRSSEVTIHLRER